MDQEAFLEGRDGSGGTGEVRGPPGGMGGVDTVEAHSCVDNSEIHL